MHITRQGEFVFIWSFGDYETRFGHLGAATIYVKTRNNEHEESHMEENRRPLNPNIGT